MSESDPDAKGATVHRLPDAARQAVLLDLLEEAERFGVPEADVLLAATAHCAVAALDDLTAAQCGELLERLRAKYARPEPAVRHVTLDEMISETGRECGLRRNVYPGMVQRGKLTQAEADERTEAMQAVYYTLKAFRELAGGWTVPAKGPQDT